MITRWILAHQGIFFLGAFSLVALLTLWGL